MAGRPTRERPVGGSAVRVVSVARPSAANFTAYAVLAPKAAPPRTHPCPPARLARHADRGHRKRRQDDDEGPPGGGARDDRADRRSRRWQQSCPGARPVRRLRPASTSLSRPGGRRRRLGPGLARRAPVGPRAAGLRRHRGPFGSRAGLRRPSRASPARRPRRSPCSREAGLAVLNADDPRVRAMARWLAAASCSPGAPRMPTSGSSTRRLTPDACLAVRLDDRGDEHTLDHAADRPPLGDGRRARLRGGDEARGRVRTGAPERSPPRATDQDRLELVHAPGGGRFLADTSKGTEASWDTAFAALAAVPARAADRRDRLAGRLPGRDPG